MFSELSVVSGCLRVYVAAPWMVIGGAARPWRVWPCSGLHQSMEALPQRGVSRSENSPLRSRVWLRVRFRT